MRNIKVEAKTVDQAVDKGLQMLGLSREEVEVKIINEGSMLKKACVEIYTFASQEERDEYLKTLSPNTKYDIMRMKGLGEMDAEELNETTMDIEKRILRKITVEDTMAADNVFSKLMGEEVEPRRKFIEENAVYVENLDV